METNTSWIPLAVMAVFFILFVWVAVAALRKARRRRMEELRESPAEEREARAEEAELRQEEAAEAKALQQAKPEAERRQDERTQPEPAQPERVQTERAEEKRRGKPAPKKAAPDKATPDKATPEKSPPAPAPAPAPAPRAAPEPSVPAAAEAAPSGKQPSQPEPAPVTVPPAAEQEAAGTAAEAKKADEALTRGLARTSASFRERLGQIFGRHPKLDPSVLNDLEEALLMADVGVGMTTRLIDAVRADLKAARLRTRAELEAALKEHMLQAVRGAAANADPFAPAGTRPRVILFVGVNGVGKTTTIGKIAALARGRGLDVVLAAGDTFRAAAVEQLTIWGERTTSRVIRGETGADPASVIFNAIEQGVSSSADLVLADTAGRMHTKTQLMDEIKKVKRSAGKARAGAPDEIWLVVDSTTGQNALQQAREFHQALTITGIILTKLDGTAKGGVVVAIADALKLPVRFIGVGEKPEDLRPFDPAGFVAAMFA
jgi:fused signal recognition particle receptor